MARMASLDVTRQALGLPVTTPLAEVKRREPETAQLCAAPLTCPHRHEAPA